MNPILIRAAACVMLCSSLALAQDTKIPGTPVPPHGHTAPVAATVTEAVTVLLGFKNSGVTGVVRFSQQTDGSVKVVVNVSGLTPNAQHAIHIHEFGDVSSDDGMSTGSHYNPDNHPHGKPGDEKAHAGDFGNLSADARGNATLELTTTSISVAGERNPVIGRSIIVHDKPDDFGQPVGNAGGRIAGGVIGVAKAK